jgi:hypothetical protein
VNECVFATYINILTKDLICLGNLLTSNGYDYFEIGRAYQNIYNRLEEIRDELPLPDEKEEDEDEDKYSKDFNE